jgi:putative protease
MDLLRTRPLRWKLTEIALTPALSLRETVNAPQAVDETGATESFSGGRGCPLSPGERAGVRGNGTALFGSAEQKTADAPHPIPSIPPSLNALGCSSPPLGDGPSPPRLAVLVRSLPQLEAALELGVETLYCDFEDPKRYRDAVGRFREMPRRGPDAAIYAAPPRIFKTGEDWVLKQVRSCEADGYLVRNYDHLAFFASDRCVGDYSLNIANRLAAEYYKTQFHLERVTASYDLNFAQLEALLQAAPPAWFEITLHQHIPMFHMEHCVFCAFLTDGTDYTNCGRPCDRHDLKLRDRVGAEHPVKADAGCRNTVFNSMAQTGADYVAQMLALGARHFRLEFLNESPDMVRQTIQRYRQLLRGEITGQQVWRELKLLNQLGVTRGQIAGAKG